LAITGKFTNRNVSSEWPKQIIGPDGYNINPDSYRFYRETGWFKVDVRMRKNKR
jgi:hypothetical protein